MLLPASLGNETGLQNSPSHIPFCSAHLMINDPLPRADQLLLLERTLSETWSWQISGKGQTLAQVFALWNESGSLQLDSWGWIYTSRLSWFKRSLLPKEDIPLRVASSRSPPSRKPQHSLHPGLIQLSSPTSQAVPRPTISENQGCAGVEGWRCYHGVWEWELSFAAQPNYLSSSSHNVTSPWREALNSFGFLTTDTQKHQPFHKLNLPLFSPGFSLSRFSFSSSIFGIEKKNILVKQEGRGFRTKLHRLYSGPSVIPSLKVLFLYHHSVPPQL